MTSKENKTQKIQVWILCRCTCLEQRHWHKHSPVAFVCSLNCAFRTAWILCGADSTKCWVNMVNMVHICTTAPPVSLFTTTQRCTVGDGGTVAAQKDGWSFRFQKLVLEVAKPCILSLGQQRPPELVAKRLKTTVNMERSAQCMNCYF